ncbi:transcriptional regulator [Candidatus Bathyarchaeota archaeon]|nr:transcriptional regulator [Candidatus Bathyarchaeota archaeon]
MSEPKDEFPDIRTIDKLIHEPVRLLLMAHLYVVESADFLYLMNQLGLTFGNLSSHMTKLEEAGYINVEKEFVDKKPVTRLSLTDEGRVAFSDYRERMRHLFVE